MKRLFKRDAKKIAKSYDLGRVKSIELIEHGLVNHNFILKTEKGEFIIRFIGHEFNKFKKERIKLEFKVLNYLIKNKFSCEVPKPIKNKQGKFISNLKNKPFWVYKKIQGEYVDKINNTQFKNIAKTLAQYHKFVKKIKINRKVSDWSWLLERYSKMKRIKPKNKIDRLMLRNVDFFHKTFEKINNIKFRENLLTTHSDFHKSNLLFKDNEVIAILDFDNLDINPRIKDISYTIKNTCFDKKGKLDKKRVKFFLREYEKINPLSKKEKEMIIYYIIRDNCIVFWWFYEGMKKGLDRKYNLIKWTVNTTKDLVKE